MNNIRTEVADSESLLFLCDASVERKLPKTVSSHELSKTMDFSKMHVCVAKNPMLFGWRTKWKVGTLIGDAEVILDVAFEDYSAMIQVATTQLSEKGYQHGT